MREDTYEMRTVASQIKAKVMLGGLNEVEQKNLLVDISQLLVDIVYKIHEIEGRVK